jgi:hypothetical protein
MLHEAENPSGLHPFGTGVKPPSQVLPCARFPVAISVVSNCGIGVKRHLNPKNDGLDCCEGFLVDEFRFRLSVYLRQTFRV